MASVIASPERAAKIAKAIGGEWSAEDMYSWPEAYGFACSLMDGERLAADKAAEVLRRWSLAIVKAATPIAPVTLADYADAPSTPAIETTRTVAQGYYTVAFPDGSHVTLRVRQWNGKASGHMVLSYLSGSNNEQDYTGMGDIQPNGTLRYWRNYANGYERQKAAVAILFGATSEELAKYGEAYAMESGQCCRCGRTLTVPASLNRGMGPECAKK